MVVTYLALTYTRPSVKTIICIDYLILQQVHEEILLVSSLSPEETRSQAEFLGTPHQQVLRSESTQPIPGAHTLNSDIILPACMWTEGQNNEFGFSHELSVFSTCDQPINLFNIFLQLNDGILQSTVHFFQTYWILHE